MKIVKNAEVLMPRPFMTTVLGIVFLRAKASDEYLEEVQDQKKSGSKIIGLKNRKQEMQLAGKELITENEIRSRC